MEITKVKTAEIIQVAEQALWKLHGKNAEALAGVADCMGKLVNDCVDSGYKLTIRCGEFFDFIDAVTRQVRATDTVTVICVPRNPTVDILDKVRTLCDNAVDSVTNVDTGLLNSVVIYAVGIKPDCREEYAIDYAARLLRHFPR